MRKSGRREEGKRKAGKNEKFGENVGRREFRFPTVGLGIRKRLVGSATLLSRDGRNRVAILERDLYRACYSRA